MLSVSKNSYQASISLHSLFLNWCSGSGVGWLQVRVGSGTDLWVFFIGFTTFRSLVSSTFWWLAKGCRVVSTGSCHSLPLRYRCHYLVDYLILMQLPPYSLNTLITYVTFFIPLLSKAIICSYSQNLLLWYVIQNIDFFWIRTYALWSLRVVKHHYSFQCVIDRILT